MAITYPYGERARTPASHHVSQWDEDLNTKAKCYTFASAYESVPLGLQGQEVSQ